jgi:hypothetical protein
MPDTVLEHLSSWASLLLQVAFRRFWTQRVVRGKKEQENNEVCELWSGVSSFSSFLWLVGELE